MSKAIIKLCYRKIIDINAQKAWDKAIFDDSFQEFYMQSQFYNQEGKYKTLKEIIEAYPQAEKLHYLTSTAIVGYIHQLKEIMPDIQNAFRQLFLPFKYFRFEIIHSNVKNKNEHQVAIYFYSEPIYWLDTVDNQLLISLDYQKEMNSSQEFETTLLSIQPYLNIISYQPI